MTLLNEIIAIESYINKLDNPGDNLVFQAKMLTDPALKKRVHAQKLVVYLACLYYRNKLKKEVAIAGKLLLNDPEKSAFKKLINEIFNS